MTRYDRNHKSATHDAIVAAASKLLRERGVANVSVADVMQNVGLTHGGFYAHFENRDDLVGQACAHGLLEAAEQRFGGAEDAAEDLAGYIESYLSLRHRDTPAGGCVVAALGGELGRQSARTRASLTDAAGRYVEGLASLLPEGADPDTAWALLAGLAGTVMLARAVDDPALAERILAAGRHLYTGALGSGGSAVPAGDVS